MKKNLIAIFCFYVLVLFVILICPNISLSGILPDTGQTRCYDNSREITCPESGDFYGQDAQYPCNTQSYTKLDEFGNPLPDDAPWPWAMVRDNVTGLIWEVKDSQDGIQDYSNPNDADNTYTWYDSNSLTNGGEPGTPGDGTDTEDFINALNDSTFGGYHDWRLPSIKELSSIQNFDADLPSIDTGYFPNTVTSYYWSSTTYANIAVTAWWGGFYYAIVLNSSKESTYNVRAVRGEPLAENVFAENDDGTVTDTSTGLMWEQKMPDTMNSRFSWQDALSYCENLILNNDGEWTSGDPNASGAKYDDWRLPDVNELKSIVDYDLFNPTIDPVFEYTEPSLYWSSTTSYGTPYFGWYVNFYDGSVSMEMKIEEFLIRAVRGGDCASDETAIIFDIKSNPLNLKCQGALPAAIMGTEDFDVAGIDPDSLRLTREGIADGVAPLSYKITDAIALDHANMLLKFRVPEVVQALMLNELAGQTVTLTLIGETFDGKSISGQDAVLLLGNIDRECHADFDCDTDVDGSDALTFKHSFGRSGILNPCNAENPCDGDFDNDGDVDGYDAFDFKAAFGTILF
jgi:hypothetical protein